MTAIHLVAHYAMLIARHVFEIGFSLTGRACAQIVIMISVRGVDKFDPFCSDKQREILDFELDPVGFYSPAQWRTNGRSCLLNEMIATCDALHLPA
ncbi:hypothetical protein [Bradyrhizobium uaiense]|uniref:Uncharacterized protein n=1 Tax=Bradyrhizobium uaiense TaxID=2594946 RepID=A0A6P1BSI5_9BRAD|nr:hypothetical protein [Bradyrhizobium uaiense]NEV01154.1 hypothetical protein [Bradyrhizobium uaiense]